MASFLGSKSGVHCQFPLPKHSAHICITVGFRLIQCPYPSSGVSRASPTNNFRKWWVANDRSAYDHVVTKECVRVLMAHLLHHCSPLLVPDKDKMIRREKHFLVHNTSGSVRLRARIWRALQPGMGWKMDFNLLGGVLGLLATWLLRLYAVWGRTSSAAD